MSFPIVIVGFPPVNFHHDPFPCAVEPYGFHQRPEGRNHLSSFHSPPHARFPETPTDMGPVCRSGNPRPYGNPRGRAGRLTLILENTTGTDANANLTLARESGSGIKCNTTIASSGIFMWESADLDEINPTLNNFNYSAIPVAANSRRTIRFKMVSIPNREKDGDRVWNFQVNGTVFAMLTVEDDEARPYIGSLNHHPYKIGWDKSRAGRIKDPRPNRTCAEGQYGCQTKRYSRCVCLFAD